MRNKLSRRLAALILAAFALSLTPALASQNPGGARATLKGSVVFRKGPGDRYEEAYTLSQGTDIVAIEREQSGAETWTLCEFQVDGGRVRGYANGGLRLEDDIPYADHAKLTRHLVNAATVFAAPDLDSREYDDLPEGKAVLFLGFEGNYCFIEYDVDGRLCRGYIREECFMPDLGEFAEDFPENNGDTLYVIKETAKMYSDPDEGAEALLTMPFGASAALIFDAYYDRAPVGWVPIRYGGLFGWGRLKDFSDLRFDSIEGARETLTLMGEYED